MFLGACVCVLVYVCVYRIVSVRNDDDEEEAARERRRRARLERLRSKDMDENSSTPDTTDMNSHR